jgi:hypothetical protein
MRHILSRVPEITIYLPVNVEGSDIGVLELKETVKQLPTPI